jgi:hypothetical protein
MKTALPFICFFMLCIFAAAAENDAVDVVHLKDGNVLRGIITERQTYPEEQITLTTRDGLEITISMDKIEKITKESADGEPVGEGATRMTAMGKYAAEVNLLGLLQFGPLARFYFGLGNDLFIAAHVRIGFAGALIYLLFDYPLPDIGVGATFLWFFPMAPDNRLYAGIFAEASLNIEADIVVTGGANAGYRFRFPSGRYWNVGGIAGISYNTWTEFAFFFGMVELSWGLEFPRSR